jgi:hypothetical protein
MTALNYSLEVSVVDPDPDPGGQKKHKNRKVNNSFFEVLDILF